MEVVNQWHNAREKRNVLIGCVVANMSLTLILCITVPLLGHNSKYFRWGPQTDLVVISVSINNWSTYAGVASFIVITNSVKMIVQHIGWSVLGFTTFDPYKMEIWGFNSKLELNILTNAMQVSDAIRFIFELVASTQQLDLALWSVFGAEFTGIFVVRWMLKKKKFITQPHDLEEGTPLLNR